MRHRRKCIGLLLVASGLVFAGAALLWLRAPSSNGAAAPYESSSQIVVAIKSLPEIDSVGFSARERGWTSYVAAAKRLQVTAPAVVRKALARLTDPLRRGAPFPDFSDQIKVMLLLRVTFECPPGRPVPLVVGGRMQAFPTEGLYRGDLNWPLKRALGRFYLAAPLASAYWGPPYDAAAEFNWMLTNGIKRDL